jgi:hypothetical protein
MLRDALYLIAGVYDGRSRRARGDDESCDCDGKFFDLPLPAFAYAS